MTAVKRLSCPHCGAKMAFERPTCGACGEPIAWMGQDEPEQLPPEPTESSRGWMIGIIVAITVIGLAGVAFIVERSTPRSAGSARPQGQGERAAGYAAYQAGDYPAALARFQEALGRNPNDADALNNVGQVLLRLKRPQEALRFLENAVAARPEIATYRVNLATALEQAGQLSRAVEQYQAIAAAAPSDARAQRNLGRALRQMGKDDEAIPAFEKATVLDPRDAQAWLGLGLSLDRMVRAQPATEAFERFLALDPGSTEAPGIRQRLARLRQPAGEISKSP